MVAPWLSMTSASLSLFDELFRSGGFFRGGRSVKPIDNPVRESQVSDDSGYYA